MAPRNSVSMETLTLIYRAFSVFAERYFDHKGAVSEGCLAREGSEAYYVCSTAVGAVCDAKQTEYDSLVNLLKSKNVFGHFCASGSCGGAGSCLAEDTGAFNGFLFAMKAAREDPALLDALSKHAERKKHELAAYVACWEPNSQYGQVRGRACSPRTPALEPLLTSPLAGCATPRCWTWLASTFYPMQRAAASWSSIWATSRPTTCWPLARWTPATSTAQTPTPSAWEWR